MDGRLENARRKRGEGCDYCVVRLGLAGTIAGVDIDTSFFTGNFPPSASIDACYSPQGYEPTISTEWQRFCLQWHYRGIDHHHLRDIESDQVFTHLRLKTSIQTVVFARLLRVYGRPSVDWDAIDSHQQVDLAVEHGGRAQHVVMVLYGNKANILGQAAVKTWVIWLKRSAINRTPRMCVGNRRTLGAGDVSTRRTCRCGNTLR